MIGSTTPALEQSEEQSDWHPVHRANALLREALQSTTGSFETLQDRYGVESLSNAIESVMQGVHITYPTPLGTRFDDLDAEAKTISCLEALVGPIQQAPSDQPADFGDDTADGPAPVEQADGPAALPAEIWDDADDGQGFDDPELLGSDVPLEPEAQLSPRQLHMRTLLGEFRRRQRYVSLLVAASITTAVLLTLGGVVLAASLTSQRPSASDHLAPPRSTSAVWQKPAPGTTGNGLPLAIASTNRAAKGELLPGPAQADTAPLQPTAPQTILAASGRQIAFGPLLPTSHARYLLIRGLPPEATLSTGQQSGPGTWMVKGDKIADLTLFLGHAASGDYPIEVYILESGDGPQARRNFVLRVAPPGHAYAKASSPNLTSATFDAWARAPAYEEPSTPAESAALRDRAIQLLREGDIAAARLLLFHLAERGDGEAAYDLARSFDPEMLAELGAKALYSNPARARSWYERAVQDGNVKAAERLKVLASLSGTGPSD